MYQKCNNCPHVTDKSNDWCMRNCEHYGRSPSAEELQQALDNITKAESERLANRETLLARIKELEEKLALAEKEVISRGINYNKLHNKLDRFTDIMASAYNHGGIKWAELSELLDDATRYNYDERYDMYYLDKELAHIRELL